MPASVETTKKNRKMVTSPRRTLIVASKVLLLFAGASAYFAGSFSLESTEFNVQYVSMAEQAFIARRHTIIGEVGASIKQYMLAASRSAVFRPAHVGSAGGKIIGTVTTPR